MFPQMKSIGSLTFHSTPCPEMLNFVAQIPIELNTKLCLPTNAEIKSFRWNYPSHLMIRFFKNEKAETPYATITGPSQMRFAEEFCSFSPKYHSANVILDGIDGKESAPIFPCATSYFIISML
jgi:hypothetical protein